MKILIADDSAFMRTILKASLKDVPDLEYMEAENGDVAVELYRNYRFAVVFLDIIMPVKNGIMAMEEIRQINPEAKIIIVSSVSQDEMVEKAKSLKANEFLAKPFQPAQIKEVFLRVSAEPTSTPADPANTEAAAAPQPEPQPVAPTAMPQIAVDTSVFMVNPASTQAPVAEQALQTEVPVPVASQQPETPTVAPTPSTVPATSAPAEALPTQGVPAAPVPVESIAPLSSQPIASQPVLIQPIEPVQTSQSPVTGTSAPSPVITTPTVASTQVTEQTSTPGPDTSPKFPPTSLFNR